MFEGDGMLLDYQNAEVPSASASGWGNLASGALQGAMTLGGQYLTRRLDIDLAKRLTGMQPSGQMQGEQVQPTAAFGQLPGAGITLGQLLPYALIAGAAWLLLKD